MESCTTHSILSSSFHSAYLRFIHVIPCINGSFLFIAEWFSIVWIYQNLFICSIVHGYLCCFQFLVMANKAVINSHVQAIVHTYLLLSKCVCAEWLGHRIGMFTFIRISQSVFHNGCATIHFYRQYMRAPVAPYTCHNLVWLVFQILDIQRAMWW